MVLPDEDETLGQVPVAYLSVRGVEGMSESADALAVAGRVRQRLHSRLPRSKRPVELRVVARLPSTATGKVVRHALRGLTPVATLPGR
jgi:acyl-coenzyme A synthetase/AMP-(fatty) acid ligase